MHIVWKAALGAAIVVSVATSARAGVNLVSDGDFSSPSGGASFVTYFGGSTIGPWAVTGGSVDLIGGYWQAPNSVGGSVDLDGDSPGGLSQNIVTIPGHTYEASFYLSGNPDGTPATKMLTVSAGATSPSFSYTVGGNTHGDMDYVLEDFTFTATGSSTTLDFTSDDVGTPYGPVIGDVMVAAVPEPATILLLGTGVFAVAAIRQRRMHQTCRRVG